MTFPSLKWCIVGVLVLSSAGVSSAAGAAPSMVCGKPSIRKELLQDSKDLNSQSWDNIKLTATTQVTAMAKAVEKFNAELVDLEAAAAAKKAEFTPSELSADETTDLVKNSLGFDSAADAKKTDCGYAEDVSYDDLDTKYAGEWDASIEKFEQQADEKIKQARRTIKRTVFIQACTALIGEEGTACGDLCVEFSEIASDIKVESASSLDGPTYDELVNAAEAKRSELARAQKDHKECVDSVATINGLVAQFTAAERNQRRQKSSCGRTKRMLRSQEKKLDKLTIEFEAAKKTDAEAQDALKTALASEATALEFKQQAADTLKMWQEHMALLEIAITKQAKLVRQTEEAVRRADAASAAVSDFKDKLSTALIGLVTYYDEAVRQPLRKMGIREEVNIEALFPKPMETAAAESLTQSLAATKAFCEEKMASFAKLPEIEASGTKLTAICDSQDWDAVSGEVDAVVSAKRTLAITNLQTAQKKVASYSGPLADKATGEVEGVWKAMALFGGTQFSTNYLSGWRFANDGAGKGSKAGFMMELATALKKAREDAVALWEEAKEEMIKLEEEKKNVADILVVCEKFLQDMIAEYEAAVETRKEAKIDADKARVALEKVREQKETLETKIAGTKVDLENLNVAVDEAVADLKATHETAMGSFMELLHASEHQEGDSWD